MRLLSVALSLLLLLETTRALSSPAAQQLRTLLNSGELSVMPCCYDGLTARLVEAAGFEVTFMTGYGVSASRGFPDVQLVSFGEMQDSARTIAAATSLPFIADGDTGYGNAMNVKRTVKGFAQVGAAGVMIEDQRQPKRCGHTRGKAIVDRHEAALRIRAAVDARDEIGGDVVIVARTDANGIHGFDEALARCRLFRDLGADVTFMEAPKTVDEMRRYCDGVSGPKLANMLEGGLTPVLPPAELEDIGFALAAYPTTLLSTATKAMQDALAHLKAGTPLPEDALLPFPDLCATVGFEDYFRDEVRYASEPEEDAPIKRE